MDRFTLAVVGGVLLLIAAGLGAAAWARGSTQPPDLSTPSGIVLAYAQAERRGDPRTAWDLLAPSEQARLDHDRFLARTADGTAESVYLTTQDERLDADGASVVLVRTYVDTAPGLFGGHGSYSTRTTVRLVRSGQDWRISVPPDVYSLALSEDKRP
jgi:hypothetical protein